MTRSSISGAGKHLHLPRGDLRAKRLVGTKEKLLASLAAGIEGARDLRAAKGAVGQKTAVFAREGNPLRHALVDDRGADLGQAVDIRLARPKVTALDGVVEEAIDAVAVVLIVLRGVYSALRGDRVSAWRALS